MHNFAARVQGAVAHAIFLFCTVAVVTAVVTIFTFDAQATECAESVGTCAYYSCINSQMQCNSSQYFERFAGPYCNKFDALRDHFTPNGQATLQRIKTCLQNRVESDPQFTCENALDKAYGHHRDCYLSSGFCHVSTHDKLAIFDVVYKELRHSGFRKAMLQTVSGCFRQGVVLDQSEVRLLNNSILLRQ